MITLIALVDRTGHHDQMSWLELGVGYDFYAAHDDAYEDHVFLSKTHDSDVQIWLVDADGDIMAHICDDIALDPAGLGYPTDEAYLLHYS